ncbi:hypothetical protein Q73_03580 [Bacillus coahuilensis m2-6]|uniref:antibiotic biosynthesis monooxygenase family protein n=1 Tax=Bacillus coahuilensis TaxID=408580 RepID=UPI00075048D7|nr:antibiotic biosynthesis monooxygenase [Bacillus coahuilensis]KUP09165.1 hypothetical protein Q73_03580 [Bacillus coahuilensis m2-6]
MKIYMTSGTYEYLQTKRNAVGSETTILMQNENTSLLLHETIGDTFFNEPRSYEVIDASGALRENGFVVMNNIPVTDEGRPVFEDRFKSRARAIESVPGFIAIRVLRPLNSDTYIILTQWDDKEAFKNWQSSQAYNKAHEKRGTGEGMDQKHPSIFTRPSFVTTYTIPTEEE